MPSSIIVQHPNNPSHLFLLFHGVGASPESLASLGQVLAQQFKKAAIVSVQAPDTSDFGQGFQWFSVQGVTEENRLQRIKDSMPSFVANIKTWQQKFNLSAENTSLIGFSQGAIMSLSSTQLVEATLATNIVSLSGRFAVLPTKVPKVSQIIFLHGDQDNVIDYRFAQQAHEALKSLTANSHFDLIANLAHSINQTEVRLLLDRLANK